MRRGGIAALADAARRSLVAPARSAGHARALATDASASSVRWVLHRARAQRRAGGLSRARRVRRPSAAVAACAAASSAPALADAARASGVPFDRAREVMAFLSEKGAAFPLAEVRPEDPGAAAAAAADAHGRGEEDGRRTCADLSERRRSSKAAAARAAAVSSPSSRARSALALATAGRRPRGERPARLAITAAAAAEHPALGAEMRAMLAEDAIDERMAVMLLLIFERRRGASSQIVASTRSPARRVSRRRSSTAKTRSAGWRARTCTPPRSRRGEQLDLVLREHVRPAGPRLVRAMRAEEKRARREARAGPRMAVCAPKVFEKAGRRDRLGRGHLRGLQVRWAYACFWSRAAPLGNDPARRPRWRLSCPQ